MLGRFRKSEVEESSGRVPPPVALLGGGDPKPSGGGFWGPQKKKRVGIEEQTTFLMYGWRKVEPMTVSISSSLAPGVPVARGFRNYLE